MVTHALYPDTCQAEIDVFWACLQREFQDSYGFIENPVSKNGKKSIRLLNLGKMANAQYTTYTMNLDIPIFYGEDKVRHY